MTRYRLLPPLILIGLIATGCNRSDEAARNVIVTARKESVSAPRSIMRPAVAVAEVRPAPPAPTLVTIPFGKPAAALDDAQRAALDALAARLAGTGDRLILRGHTDSHGSDRRNRLVSLRRARLVAAYLVGKGVAEDRMQLVALGEDRPVAPNARPDGSDDPDARARNRRVEIEIVPAVAPVDPAKPAKG